MRLTTSLLTDLPSLFAASLSSSFKYSGNLIPVGGMLLTLHITLTFSTPCNDYTNITL